MSDSFLLRPSVREDVPALLELIQELAVFEKAPNAVINTIANLEKYGFEENPLFVSWVALIDEVIVGMAICYIRYSTWKGPVFYLEDIVVTETHRNKGIGKRLFETCLQYAKIKNYPRMSWQVLDWNELAIGFYEKYGAHLDGEWINCSIDLNDKPTE